MPPAFRQNAEGVSSPKIPLKKIMRNCRETPCFDQKQGVCATPGKFFMYRLSIIANGFVKMTKPEY